MTTNESSERMERWRGLYPEKFAAEDTMFSHIRAGARIFIGTGCGEPQRLVRSLLDYVKSHPKAFFDAELLQVWSLGVTPYADTRFKDVFRRNSFFIGRNSREAVNKGLADYTPIFLSSVPELFRKKRVPIDVALVQTSLPDDHGYVSLGVSVDIVKSAIESAGLVFAQVNTEMPRVHGETFVHLKDIDYVMVCDEPLLEFETIISDDIAQRVGKYVSRIVQDGDTIQVGYGSIPNAIMGHLKDKRNLGVHTELLTDGIVELMKAGAVDNSAKELNRGKTVAAFCMGKSETYRFINDNPAIEFRPVDYTNNPLNIARNRNMTAINSGLEIDLTGQATAESLGKYFFSGIGGQADFMRGAILSPGGKTVLAMQSTAEDGMRSRIVPFLTEGAGVTLTRGDLHYVVTEYGIAFLHGKNIRERALDLIAIAHPRFRTWLIEEAKKLALIYPDQAFIPGKEGEYPEALETLRTTRNGMNIFLRPVRIADEHLLKDFFYSLSSDSRYRRFISSRRDMLHERLQKMVVIDYTKEMVILAVVEAEGTEIIAGIGQYFVDEHMHTAEVAFVVRDEFQDIGIGSELLDYLVYIGRKSGLLGLSAVVLADNRRMIHMFEDAGFAFTSKNDGDMYEMRLSFRA